MDGGIAFLDGKVVLHPGDCREVLRRLPDASIDSAVTDPPYALVSIGKRFGKPGAAPTKDGDVYSRASAGFMGQGWDTGETAFSVDFWAEVMRVLKPGGHLVGFGGTRAHHQMWCAIEAAGFEIRDSLLYLFDLDPIVEAFFLSLDPWQQQVFLYIIDQLGPGGMLAWVYGSGFPKSHDVSKGLDKRRDDRRDILQVTTWLADAADRAAVSRAAIDAHMGTSDMAGWWTSRLVHRCQCPTWEQWQALRALLGFGEEMDEEVQRLNRRKGEWGEAAKVRGTIEATGGLHGGSGNTVGAFTGRQLGPEAVLAEAQQWQGWGTAIKPAWEPIVLARKPLAGTVAESVVQHGTGALNISACRIGAAESGRWPANIVHDGSSKVLSAFPDAPGQLRGVTGAERAKRTVNAYGDFGETRHGAEPRTDSGSAARFFYSAKADADDRLGSKHPTVKPVDLMQWLCRLVTPPGGTVLDPFAGTGTTGEAAFREGFRAVLIEREPQFQADIARRMELALAGPATRKAESVKARAKDEEPLPLFADGEAA